jgi:uncharacterized membrane protein YhaH (DUF805 family)
MSMEEIEITEYSEPQKTGFIDAIKKGFKGYVVWNARSTRSEYWWWTLFAIIVAIVSSILDSIIFGGDLGSISPIYSITTLALFLPGLSVWIRRLHDIDRTGWWVWIGLIPIVGFIILLIFTLLPSKMEPTRWNNRIQA